MVIADAGFWLALAARRDRYYAQARDRLERLSEPLVTTWPVVTEAGYLILRELGPAAVALGSTIADDGLNHFAPSFGSTVRPNRPR